MGNGSFDCRFYVSTHPLSVAIACCVAVSLTRFLVPMLQALPLISEDRAFRSDSRLVVVSFGQPFTAISTPIVPAKVTSSRAAQETKVVSIFEVTLLKSRTPPTRRRLLQPWNSSETEVRRDVSSPPISCKFVQP